MRACCTCVLLLLLAIPLRAQTRTLAWDAPPEATTLVAAQALIYTLYVNSGPGLVVATVTCAGTSAPFACSAPLPASVPTALDTKLELTAKTATSGESARSVPFIVGPTAPTRLRVT